MIKKTLGAFDATVTFAYKGAVKLFWAVVIVAVVVSVVMFGLFAGIYAVVH